MSSPSIPVRELVERPYIDVLCYPSSDLEEAKRRVVELEGLGVEALIFEGRTQIGGLRVIGKGCVGLVVKAVTGEGLGALKIRRVDADRATLLEEAETLRSANRLGVGPKLLGGSENYLLTEFMEGTRIQEWIFNLQGKGTAGRLRRVLKELLDQCYLLDEGGIDHGELSNLSKHVIVGRQVTLVDFESASTLRRPSNVTSAVQYLFIGGPVARKVRRITRVQEVGGIIEILRRYKRSRSAGHYQELLRKLKLS